MTFDRIVMVDWSAAAVPTTGRDSIWTAEATVTANVGRPINHPTRSAAMSYLAGVIDTALAVGERLLMGFDFAFGYPRGVATRLGGGWRSVWRWMEQQLRDEADNANDRFEVAARLNALFPGEGPLWGRPAAAEIAGLEPKRPKRAPFDLPWRRHVEDLVPKAQPTFKLAYPGSVGSQTITGIARLETLRKQPAWADKIRVWPFETGFAEDLSAPILLAEIFPSLHPVVPLGNEVRDAAQVRTLAQGYAALSATGGLVSHLAGPNDPTMRRDALAEEGWIMSVGDAPMPLGAIEMSATP